MFVKRFGKFHRAYARGGHGLLAKKRSLFTSEIAPNVPERTNSLVSELWGPFFLGGKPLGGGACYREVNCSATSLGARGGGGP